MNLALTYASRTQHVRLARHISELIQQKTFEELSDEDDDFDNPTGQVDDEWSNQNADDVMYAKSRSSLLNKKSDLISKAPEKKINLSNKFGKASSSTDGRSRFSSYMDKVKHGKFLSSTSSSGQRSRTSNDDRFYEHGNKEKGDIDHEDENSLDANYDDDGGVTSTTDNKREGGGGGGGGYDETKELFSDSEQDAARDGDDGEVGDGEEMERDYEMEDDFSFTPTRRVGEYSSSGSMKRANPFKVSTGSASVHTCVYSIYTIAWLSCLDLKLTLCQSKTKKNGTKRG